MATALFVVPRSMPTPIPCKCSSPSSWLIWVNNEVADRGATILCKAYCLCDGNDMSGAAIAVRREVMGGLLRDVSDGNGTIEDDVS